MIIMFGCENDPIIIDTGIFNSEVGTKWVYSNDINNETDAVIK